MDKPKPWFWPDTQGFLAVGIIIIMSVIVLILLTKPVQMTDTVQGVLMTVVGVLASVLKDVYAYYFNSSAGSRSKDDTIKALAEAPKALALAAPADTSKWTK